MPAATPQATLDKIVELRKQKKSYRQIEAETGANPLVIAKTLKKAGLTGANSPSAAPVSTAATALPPVPASIAPMGTDSSPRSRPAPIAPSVATSGSDLAEFQPPPPPAAKPKASRRFQCEGCGAVYALDASEDPDTTPCPSCERPGGR